MNLVSGANQGLDLVPFLWAHIDNDHQLKSSILPVIENYLSIKCFPDLNTCWHYDDKVRQYYLLKNSVILWSKHGFSGKRNMLWNGQKKPIILLTSTKERSWFR